MDETRVFWSSGENVRLMGKSVPDCYTHACDAKVCSC